MTQQSLLLERTVTKLTTLPVALKTLVVGDLEHWIALGRDLPFIENLQFVPFAELSGEIIQSQPDIVLSPLSAEGFDAVDVANRLRDLNFTGPYRAIAQRVRDPEIVRQEINDHAPDINFDLLIFPTATVAF